MVQIYLIVNIGTTIFFDLSGFIFNKEISTIYFLLHFAGIRRYSGGYHAKTKLKCYILTITNWVVVVSVTEGCKIKFGFTGFGIELLYAAWFMVMFFAPVENLFSLFERVRIKIKDTYHNIDGYHYIVKHMDKLLTYYLLFW